MKDILNPKGQVLLLSPHCKDWIVFRQKIKFVNVDFGCFPQVSSGKKYSIIFIHLTNGFDEPLFFENVRRTFNNVPIVGILDVRSSVDSMQTLFRKGFHGVILKEITKITSLDIEDTIYRAKALFESRNQAGQQVRFFSQIIHDLKLPISTINYALHRESELGPLSENMLNIEQASGFMKEILLRGLETSANQLARPLISDEPFFVTMVMKQINTIVSPQMEDKNLKFSFSLKSDGPFLVHGDSGRLKQIVINLLGNAIKFTKSGGKIEFQGHLKVNLQKAIFSFRIIDNGIGICESKLPHIFEDFSQAHQGLSQSLGGQGLGLGIVKTNIEEMGGTISVRSQEGKGTSFKVQIPFVASKNAAKTILVVENEPKFFEYIESLFDKKEFNLLLEENLKGAKKKISEHRVDFILSDLNLNGESRKDLAEFIDENNDQVTPMAILSGWVDSKDANYFLKKGIPIFRKSEPFAGPLLKHVRQSLLGGTLSPSILKTPAPARHMNILVVDDGEDCKLLLSAYLKPLRSNLTLCSNGLEALQKFRANHYDIVFMDINMPVLGGIDSVKRMRTWEHENRKTRIPIIALSGISFESDIVECLNAGFDAHVSKPIDRARLYKVLAQWASNPQETISDKDPEIFRPSK